MNTESIVFNCGKCGRKLQVPAAFAGKQARCPDCGTLTLISQPQVPSRTGAAPALADAASESSESGFSPGALPPVVSALPRNPASNRPELDPVPPSQVGTSGQGSLEETFSDQPREVPAKWDFLAPAQGPGELGRLGPYRILSVLGAGGMGVVFAAEDIRLQRPAALKVMLPRVAATVDSARQRFLREARAMAAIEHDHIVTIYHVDEDRDVPFIAMQLLRGESLEKRIKRDGKLPLAEVLRIGREIASALAVAHERGLVHRDIKPSNIWLEKDSSRVKLLDFGLALGDDDVTLTQPGAIVGTPAYMAPEQAEASHGVDHRCDLFSLGCVLYRTSTGLVPFAGTNTMGILLALQMHNPEPPSKLNAQLPAELSELVLQLLAKKPERRPGTAREVVDRIKAIESQLSRQPSIPVADPDTLDLPPLPETPADHTAGAFKAAAPPLAGESNTLPPLAEPTLSPFKPGKPPAAIPLGSPAPGLGKKPIGKPVPALRKTSRFPLLVLIGAPIFVMASVLALFLSGGFWWLEEEKPPVVINPPPPPPPPPPSPITPLPETPLDPKPRLHYQYDTFKRFGLAVEGTSKPLIHPLNGIGNTTTVRVDQKEQSPYSITFGSIAAGDWLLQQPFPLGTDPIKERTKNTWQTTGTKIRFTQMVDIIPGKQPVEIISGKWRWLRDTCLAAMLIENRDLVPHKVSLRMVLDTKIGDSDGVPFLAPGLTEPIVVPAKFKGEKVPDFLQAIETSDYRYPGTVAHLGLKPGGGLEGPHRVNITRWDKDQRAWDFYIKDPGLNVCVALFWEDMELKPEEKRVVGFTYGLGSMTADTEQKFNRQLGLTLDGDFEPGKEFTVLACTNPWEASKKLKLVLEPGLELVQGKAEQITPQPFNTTQSLISWKVRAKGPGQYEITVESSDKISQKKTVLIFPPEKNHSLDKAKIFD